MNNAFDITKVNFNSDGLIPVVVQAFDTLEVLMLAYMNLEALKITLETQQATYFSRSRQSLWKKGESSGNIQKVTSLYLDCDQDSILLSVDQTGIACHTGSRSCFFNEVLKGDEQSNRNIIDTLYNIIKERKLNPVEGSYTTYLFNKGIDKILKKVGEETSEIIIGAKNNSNTETVYEISDLVYHLLVLMVEQNISPIDIELELQKRRK
jgi:phosphoribosyl-ATP pyrophosphohydrolase/phosphoribosyl-AMP cyclohydrolase